MLKHSLLFIVICSFITLEAQVENPCNPDSFVRFYPDSAKAMHYKSIYAYNDRKQVLSNTSYYFYKLSPQSAASWIFYSRILYTYNADFTLSVCTIRSWNDTGWKSQYSIHYDYDSIGRLISETTILDDYNGQSINNFKEIISYNSLGKESSRTWHGWELPGQWRHTVNVLHTFDDENRVTRTVRSYWNDQDSIWKESKKDSFTYVNKQLAEKLHFNLSLNLWIKLDRDTFEYDVQGRLTKKIYQDWSPYMYENMQIYSYDTKGCLNHVDYFNNFTSSPNTWTREGRDTFFYPTATSMFIFYPNPASTTLYINAPAETPYSLIDMNGKTVLEGIVVKGENQVDIQHLSSGIYILVTPGQAQKLVIQ